MINVLYFYTDWNLRASFTKHGQISTRAQFQNSAHAFTNNAQIKEHRHNISFAYRPTQYTKRRAN